MAPKSNLLPNSNRNYIHHQIREIQAELNVISERNTAINEMLDDLQHQLRHVHVMLARISEQLAAIQKSRN